MLENTKSETDNKEDDLVSILIVCKICNSRKTIEISKSKVKQASALATVSIPKGLVCEHHFQAFIDKNFEVRGYKVPEIEIEFTPAKLDVQKTDISKNNLLEQRRILLTKLEQNKFDIETWRELGEVSYLEKKPSNAIHCFKRIVQLNKYDNRAWRNLGILYYQKNELEVAIHYLKEAIKIDHHDSETWDYLGQSYGKMGNFKKSAEAFKNAIKEDPTLPTSWYNLTLLYYENKKHKKAKAVLSEAEKKKINFGSLEDKRDILLIKLFKKLSSI